MTKSEIPVIKLSTPAGKKLLETITQNRSKRNDSTEIIVKKIISDIRASGDKALFAYTKKFDKITLTAKSIRLNPSEISQQAKKAPAPLKQAMHEAAKRIRAYHQKQKMAGFTMTTAEGRLAQIIRPLKRVAVYVPGGRTVYPSSVLMNVIPAQIAGVAQIVVVTPPRKELDPGMAFGLQLLGIKEVYRMGGAQAVAALAYGTASVQPVDKIVGPGNSFVALAKKEVFGKVDIDMVAGPSEVIVLADTTANPHHVALDLLAQAEHGSGDEMALCITENKPFGDLVARYCSALIEASFSGTTTPEMLARSCAVLVINSRAESLALVNRLAPEHLQIITGTYKRDVQKVENAGAIFLGPYTPVALGDYYIGTNHVLPTGGSARFASPLGVADFCKRMSVAEITQQGLKRCSRNVSVFARAEQFVHHALSVEKRIG